MREIKYICDRCGEDIHSSKIYKIIPKAVYRDTEEEAYTWETEAMQEQRHRHYCSTCMRAIIKSILEEDNNGNMGSSN